MGPLRKTLFLLLLPGLFPACAPKTAVLPPRDQILKHERILSQLHERSEKIQTLSAAGKIVMRTPEGPFTADEIIRLRQPDALRLETWNPVGGLQVLLIARGEKGVVSIPGESKDYHFGANGGALKRALGLDLTVSELRHLLTGSVPLTSVTPDQLRTRVEEGATVVQIHQDRRPTQGFRIDDRGRVLRWERFDSRGTPSESLVFEDFREVDGIFFPFRILFSQPQGTELVLTYRSLYLNRPIEESLFHIDD